MTQKLYIEGVSSEGREQRGLREQFKIQNSRINSRTTLLPTTNYQLPITNFQ
ncbi:hypothetical protein [Chroococcidiopsis sp.]|uniref:hypothetical protein n=1 Tax=Chroococcidiopsis sp. TaxID=3088168 RepID=UPI003F356791